MCMPGFCWTHASLSCSRQKTLQQVTLCRYLQLALLLLTEVKKGTDSQWHPYIQHLPNSVHTLLHWTNEELRELQYTKPGHEQQFLLEVGAIFCIEPQQPLFLTMATSFEYTQHCLSWTPYVPACCMPFMHMVALHLAASCAQKQYWIKEQLATALFVSCNKEISSDCCHCL